ncbi:hypothetical protein [Bacillus pseudomycoides]|uniref:hypothetical protein n=1 Tax=Bacillus pseudomycoides TaxID=64104 RepID=UPI000BED4B09|nr:hypothetical protein [Bacillus pseudomycoides]PEB42240.1 hypothetical protein COO06_07980 [Bacillus pseudomycoides]PGA62199.1 hypothetical protein COL84_13580 [Bacillus pseudomycoides]
MWITTFISAVLIFSLIVIIITFLLGTKNGKLNDIDLNRLVGAIISSISSGILLVLNNKFPSTFENLNSLTTQYIGFTMTQLIICFFVALLIVALFRAIKL